MRKSQTTTLSNNIFFEAGSIKRPFQRQNNQTRKIPKDLKNVLADPKEHPLVHPKQDKIYLGNSTAKPENPERYPIYLPKDIFDKNLFIAAAPGGGKSTLLFRILAQAIKTQRSVFISEAKAGNQGYAEGAAFNDITRYLKLKYPHLLLHRWPRGDVYFNPLMYLNTSVKRREFFDNLCEQIQTQGHITGDIVAFIHNATAIADLIIEFLQTFTPKEDLNKNCTLQSLVYFLRHPDKLKQTLAKAIKYYEQTGNNPQASAIIKDIYAQLKSRNFFFLEKPELNGSRHGVNLLTNLFDHPDLLYYSQPQPNLQELKLEDILYQQALVIISQPLYDTASKVVGPLFWDSVLGKTVELGPKPPQYEGKERLSILAVFDETHRLPVGRLGTSGDFTREYRLGLVEITPTIVDPERWFANRHVYQTLISLSPGVPEVVELMQSRLPNFFLNSTYVQTMMDGTGMAQPFIGTVPNHKYQNSQDNPGCSLRSLAMTGKFTGLLQSFELDGEGKVFWLDLQDELLANIKTLLEDALKPNCPSDIHSALDYVLGLEEFLL
ncbi:MAG: hypothetical protein DSM107014_02685 [Gomphosphaeria aponina SAG 52.96 = DSM 107014]|uniref:Uncharacterized protein n=1 Tax=Gomphosphaeria aponina SAG 52.96 = DSM 107014 TaxID=1521640 RepID=A0A941GRQ7_9CHRO|nr:hypothetical protein [Gomphosphaeria aponina SAG 52.96 = DSM 107014]